jgi:hypothetical protein
MSGLEAKMSQFLLAAQEAACVQVFGRRNAEPFHTLRRPASEKRQGTKSRLVRHLSMPRALWGIERGGGLKENEAKRSSRRVWPKAWVFFQG